MGVARAHHIESVLVGVFCVVVSVWASHNPNQTAVIGSGASLPALLIQRSALLCVLAVHPSVCRRMWMCVCVCVCTLSGISPSFPSSHVLCVRYGVERPDTADVEYTATGSSAGLAALESGSVDFAASDAIVALTPFDDYVRVPTVAAAVCLMYNVPGVGGPMAVPSTNTSLVLDAAAMAGIFLGTIDVWNHPHLVSLNPDVALPASAIEVVARANSSGTTSIFTRALAILNETFSSRVGNGSSVSFPIPPSRFHTASNSDLVSVLVSTIPNSIGYNVLAQALHSSLPCASFLSASGHVVQPSVSTLLDRIVQLDSSGFVKLACTLLLCVGCSRGVCDRFGAQVASELSPRPGSNEGAWPIAGYSHLLLRKSFIRPGSNCTDRLATQDFWSWFFDAASVAQ